MPLLEFDREKLIDQIARRAPWYQRIEFPSFGVTTTDRLEWAVLDPAYDNVFPGMDPSDGARLRPVPKFNRMQEHFPQVAGKSVLEVGCSCGFFCFEFARRGARTVTGLDIDPDNIERARFCAEILEMPNVSFEAGDLGSYTTAHDVVWGASVHEHFFFPFYYLARLLCLARERFVIETHQYVADDDAQVARLDVDPRQPRIGSHAFHLSRAMLRRYLQMLGVEEQAISETVFYDDGIVRRLILTVDTVAFQEQRAQHPFLSVLADIR